MFALTFISVVIGPKLHQLWNWNTPPEIVETGCLFPALPLQADHGALQLPPALLLPVSLNSASSHKQRALQHNTTTMSFLRPILRQGQRNLRLRQLRGLSTSTNPTQPASPRSNSSSNQVRVLEVGPRDGLQNEKTIIPLATKIELIERLAKTGLTDIEAGSFVAPKWVPQVGSFILPPWSSSS